MIFEMLLLFGMVILTGSALIFTNRILMNRIDKIFKNAREDTNPMDDHFDAMHAHDKEEAED